MRLGIRFFFFLAFLLCFSVTCNRSNHLLKGSVFSGAVPETTLEAKAILASYEQKLEEQQKALCRKEAKIDSIVQRYYKYFGFQGNVLVADKGAVIYDRSFGYADFNTKEPLTNESAFQLASVSKQFTAMGIMMLKQEGKLDFDDDVRKYIPKWPYEGMTIRHLLNHTSGLQNYMWLLEHKWKKDRAPYNHEVIAMMIKHELPLNFTPGKYFSYANTGYVVLAYIIERASGQFYGEYLKEHIFDPLGMKHTFAYSSVITRFNKEKLTGYRKRWRGYRTIPETVHDGCLGDKGIYSTAEDLFLWDQALYTEQLVSKEILKEAFTKAELRNKRKVNYGFGFRIKEDNGDKIIYHHGLWNGFRTSIIRNIDDTTTIIVLNHTNSSAKQPLVRKLEKLMNKEPEQQGVLLAAVDTDPEEN